MRLAPRSRIPVVAALVLLGAAAAAHWIYWLTRPTSDIPGNIGDSAVGFFVLIYMPSALAGIAAIVGGGLMLRWLRAGQIVATIALSVAILHAAYWFAVNLALLGECAKLPRGCGDEWENIGWGAAGLVVSAYLVVAVWQARVPDRPAPARFFR
jgi:hypothetical protein